MGYTFHGHVFLMTKTSGLSHVSIIANVPVNANALSTHGMAVTSAFSCELHKVPYWFLVPPQHFVKN